MSENIISGIANKLKGMGIDKKHLQESKSIPIFELEDYSKKRNQPNLEKKRKQQLSPREQIDRRNMIMLTIKFGLAGAAIDTGAYLLKNAGVSIDLRNLLASPDTNSTTNASEFDKGINYDTRLLGRKPWFTEDLLEKQLEVYDSPFTTDPRLPKAEGRKAFVKAYFEMCLSMGMDPAIIAMTFEEDQFGKGVGVYTNTQDHNPFNIRPLDTSQTLNSDGTSYQLDPVLQNPNGPHTEDNEMAEFRNDLDGCKAAIELYVREYWTGNINKKPGEPRKSLTTLFEIINEHAPAGGRDKNKPDQFTATTLALMKHWYTTGQPHYKNQSL